MKTTRHLASLLVGITLLLGTAAQAQGIWRCGTQGNSFSDRPCDQGQGQRLAVAPAPGAAAVQEAAEVARREAALAARLRADRLAQERRFAQAQQAHRAQQAGGPQLASAAAAPGKHHRSNGKGRADSRPGLRVATAQPPLSPKAKTANGPRAAADARTSATAARGFPAIQD